MKFSIAVVILAAVVSAQFPQRQSVNPCAEPCLANAVKASTKCAADDNPCICAALDTVVANSFDCVVKSCAATYLFSDFMNSLEIECKDTILAKPTSETTTSSPATTSNSSLKTTQVSSQTSTAERPGQTESTSRTSTAPLTPTESTESPGTGTSQQGLAQNPALIVGPVVGGLAGLLLLTGIVWFWRRRRIAAARSRELSDKDDWSMDKPQLHSESAPRTAGKAELYDGTLYEMPGECLPAELPNRYSSGIQTHELHTRHCERYRAP